MLSTEFGIVIEVNFTQPEKASLAIFFIELGSVIDVRAEHPLKAD